MKRIDMLKGIIVLVFGLVLIYLVLILNIPELTVACSVIYLAAVIAAKSFGSDKKG